MAISGDKCPLTLTLKSQISYSIYTLTFLAGTLRVAQRLVSRLPKLRVSFVLFVKRGYSCRWWTLWMFVFFPPFSPHCLSRPGPRGASGVTPTRPPLAFKLSGQGKISFYAVRICCLYLIVCWGTLDCSCFSRWTVSHIGTSCMWLVRFCTGGILRLFPIWFLTDLVNSHGRGRLGLSTSLSVGDGKRTCAGCTWFWKCSPSVQCTRLNLLRLCIWQIQ